MSTTDTAEKQTKDALTANAALVALVVDRIYPDEIPEKSASDIETRLPAVTFERGDTESTYTLDGTLRASRVTMTVIAWAKSRSEANAVAAQILAAMQTANLEQSARGAAFEPELREYAAVLSFDVWETS